VFILEIDFASSCLLLNYDPNFLKVAKLASEEEARRGRLGAEQSEANWPLAHPRDAQGCRGGALTV
jgi:hypothetical protein